MLIAGLTGGMACGKSFVAASLRELGAYIIEADQLGREVVEPGAEAYSAVVSEFGPGILLPDQTLNRPALAATVFGNDAALQKLNSIIHPAVRKRARREIAMLATNDANAIVIYVAAILFESGGDRDVSKVIFVDCPPDEQMSRALERPGATREAVLARLSHQLTAETKRARADYVIETGGAKENTLRQTKMVYEDLRRLASAT